MRLADIAPVAVASVIASEDDGFCQNDGVDWDALHDVISGAGKNGPSRGASTITMQTAKNLFLWPGRSNIRKGIEIGVALVLGAGVVEGAHRSRSTSTSPSGATACSASRPPRSATSTSGRASSMRARRRLLATSLPNPIKRNAARPSPMQRILAARIVARASNTAELDCLPR